MGSIFSGSFHESHAYLYLRMTRRKLLDIGLQFAGWFLVILCVASFWIPKVLGWKEGAWGNAPKIFRVRRPW